MHALVACIAFLLCGLAVAFSTPLHRSVIALLRFAENDSERVVGVTIALCI